MKVVFVCSPWRAADPATRESNRLRALAVCRDVALSGDVPVAPHLLFPRFLDDDEPAEREAGLRCSVALLGRCDEILVVGEPTGGMVREVVAAGLLGIRLRSRR